MSGHFCDRELRLLKEISEAILDSNFDLNEVLQKTLYGALELANAFHGQVLEVDEDELVIRATTTLLPEKEIGSRVEISDSVSGLAVETGKTENIANLDGHPRYKAFLTVQGVKGRMKSELVTPLLAHDRVIGVINLESPDSGAFNDYHEIVLETLAGQAALAIMSARARQEAEAFGEIDQMIINLSPDTDFDDLVAKLERILEITLKRIHSRYGNLMLLEGKKLVIRASAPRGQELGAELDIYHSISGLPYLHQRPVRIGNVYAPEYKDLYKAILRTEQMEYMQSELAVPMIDGNQVIGVVNIEHPRENAFTQHDEDILIALTRQAVILVKTWYAKKMQKAEERIQTILATEPFEPANVYEAILNEALSLLRAERGQLLLVHPDRLTIQATTGKERLGTEVRLDNSFCGRYVVPKGTSAIAYDLHAAEYQGAYVNYLGDEDNPMRSELAVPVFSGDHYMIGIINLESSEVSAFGKQEAETLELLANNTAIALLRAADQAFETELGEMVTELAETVILPDEWLQKLVERGLAILKAVNGQLLVLDPRKKDHLKILKRAGEKPPDNVNLHFEKCVTGKVVLTREPLLINDLKEQEWADLYQGDLEKINSEVAVPLFHNGQVAGVLNMESSRVGAFSPRHVSMLARLAQMAALAFYLGEIDNNQYSVFHSIKNTANIIVQLMPGIRQSLNTGNQPDMGDVEAVQKAAKKAYDAALRVCARQNLHPVCLKKVLDEFLDIYPLEQGSGIRLALAANLDDVPPVVADKDRLLDTLSLLVDNAVRELKHTQRPSLAITLDLEQDADYVHIVITDNGRGIPPDKIPHLFEGIASQDGTGIGLPDGCRMMHKMLGNIGLGLTGSNGTQMIVSLRKLPGVIVLMGQQERHENEHPLNVYFSSRDSRLIELASETLNDGPWQMGGILEMLSDEELDTLDNYPSALFLDLISQADQNLNLFESLTEHQIHKNKGKKKEDKARYFVHLTWAIPTMESELLATMKDITEEVYRGWLE